LILSKKLNKTSNIFSNSQYVPRRNFSKQSPKLTIKLFSIFNLDVIQALQTAPTVFTGSRVVAKGDYGTKETSVMSQTVISTNSFANVAAHANGPQTSGDFNASDRSLFCINSDGTTGASASNGNCGGLSLTSRVGIKPAFDTGVDARLSVDWVARQDASGLKAKMSSF